MADFEDQLGYCFEVLICAVVGRQFIMAIVCLKVETSHLLIRLNSEVRRLKHTNILSKQHYLDGLFHSWSVLLNRY